MDILNDELLAFWKALQENNVRYIMAGGFATASMALTAIPKDKIDVIELEKLKKIRDEDIQHP